jgi:protein gp37
MRNTSIQWCHSTINPIMGCAGCELWPSPAGLLKELQSRIRQLSSDSSHDRIADAVADATRPFQWTSELYAARNQVAAQVAATLGLPPGAADELADVFRGNCKCYAGLLGTLRAGHAGYADHFEVPKAFPGRVAGAARWRAPSPAENAAKPWLIGAPRMIFISDMGDALSADVSFDYLRSEIIEPVNSADGSRQLWLWLTKRPGRLAEFGRWLADQGVAWPDHLVAMTTVTSQTTHARVDQLRQVPAKWKGLSCEPVFSALDLDLTGINWVIAGGGSDILAEPFHVEWALQLQQHCREHDAAFFLKQLGRRPFFDGQPINLADPHGGEWDEWPDPNWKVREIPAAFRGFAQPPTISTRQRPASPGPRLAPVGKITSNSK